MKLPKDFDQNVHFDPEEWAMFEAIVRDCAKVLEDRHKRWAKRSYPPPSVLLELRDAILARYGLEPEGK